MFVLLMPYCIHRNIDVYTGIDMPVTDGASVARFPGATTALAADEADAALVAFERGRAGIVGA